MIRAMNSLPRVGRIFLTACGITIRIIVVEKLRPTLLTVIDALNAASHYLGYVSAAVEAENDNCHADTRQICAYNRQHDIIEYQQLHHHGSASEKGDIEGAYCVEHSGQNLILRYNSYGGDKRTDEYTDYETHDGYLEGILQALDDLDIALCLKHYFIEFINLFGERC